MKCIISNPAVLKKNKIVFYTPRHNDLREALKIK